MIKTTSQSLLHKAQGHRTQPNCASKPPSEIRLKAKFKTKLKCKILEIEKRKPRKEEDYNLKSWLKTKTRSCEWIHFWPGEQKY